MHTIIKSQRVVNNIQAPSYKVAKFLNKNLQNLSQLPNTYTTKISYELAQELHNIQINEHSKIITLDIKDLYVNLPTKNILHITKFWLNKHNHDQTITEQTLYLLEVILKQNYFQYNNRFYHRHGITHIQHASRNISTVPRGNIHETLFGEQENHILQNVCGWHNYNIWQNKIDEDTIHNNINNIDEHLEFKLSSEENETINYLDLSINRETNNMNLNIYRKPTYIDIAIHSSSNDPYDHKLAAFK
jgi:hypothetical protein